MLYMILVRFVSAELVQLRFKTDESRIKFMKLANIDIIKHYTLLEAHTHSFSNAIILLFCIKVVHQAELLAVHDDIYSSTRCTIPIN